MRGETKVLCFPLFQHTTHILECLKQSLALIPVISDRIQEICQVGSGCYFNVVELVDGLQISSVSVSSTQSDSLTRTSVIVWPILILEWLYRLYSLGPRLSLPWNQEERAWCITFMRKAVNSLYLNLVIPIKMLAILMCVTLPYQL